MKCQILFSGKNKKNIINLLSAENAQRVVKVKPIKGFNSMSYGPDSGIHDTSTHSPLYTRFQLCYPYCS